MHDFGWEKHTRATLLNVSQEKQGLPFRRTALKIKCDEPRTAESSAHLTRIPRWRGFLDVSVVLWSVSHNELMNYAGYFLCFNQIWSIVLWRHMTHLCKLWRAIWRCTTLLDAFQQAGPSPGKQNAIVPHRNGALNVFTSLFSLSWTSHPDSKNFLELAGFRLCGSFFWSPSDLTSQPSAYFFRLPVAFFAQPWFLFFPWFCSH